MLTGICIGASAGLTFGVVFALVMMWIVPKKQPPVYHITRQDYFAANAMNALLTKSSTYPCESIEAWRDVAKSAFATADAMIASRTTER